MKKITILAPDGLNRQIDIQWFISFYTLNYIFIFKSPNFNVLCTLMRFYYLCHTLWCLLYCNVILLLYVSITFVITIRFSIYIYIYIYRCVCVCVCEMQFLYNILLPWHSWKIAHLVCNKTHTFTLSKSVGVILVC